MTTLTSNAERLTASHPGVIESSTTNNLYPKRDYTSHETHSPNNLKYPSPGDTILIYDTEAEIKSTGMNIIESGRQGSKRVIQKIGITLVDCDTEAQLYIDRDPYMLYIPDEGVWAINSTDVSQVTR